MDDELEVEIQDLEIDEIRELLREAGAELSSEQTEQLALLVAQAGGVQEALAALQQLEAPREAA
jgi:hypothetical protein